MIISQACMGCYQFRVKTQADPTNCRGTLSTKLVEADNFKCNLEVIIVTQKITV